MPDTDNQHVAEIFTAIYGAPTPPGREPHSREFYRSQMFHLGVGSAIMWLGRLKTNFDNAAARTLEIRPIQSWYSNENAAWAKEFKDYGARAEKISQALVGMKDAEGLDAIIGQVTQLKEDLTSTAQTIRAQKYGLAFTLINQPEKRALSYNDYSGKAQNIEEILQNSKKWLPASDRP